MTEEARRRAIFRQLAHEERSIYIRERERTQPTEPPQTREEALDRIRAKFQELERNANRSRGVRSPLGWRPRSPSKLTARENEQATDLRLRISRRKAAWVEAEREARGRPEEIRRRTAEKFREGARCDARAAGIAAVQNVRDVVESAVYRWRMRGEFGGVQGWEFGAVFEDFAKGFRER